jgi:cytochrome c biogenesis protein CcmG/thiol:disulfide interchange protein DsbE
MSDLTPLPKARGHLSFIWLGVVLVVVGVAQIRLQAETSATEPTDPLAVQTVGEPAPDFTVRLLGEEGTFTLSESLAEDGRPVILNFWASWCFPCRTEMPVLDAAALARPDLTFIGVATDDTEQGSAEFAAEMAVSYPLGWDSTGLIGNKYGAFALPVTVVIDAEGIIVSKKLGELTEESLEELLATLDG